MFDKNLIRDSFKMALHCFHLFLLLAVFRILSGDLSQLLPKPNVLGTNIYVSYGFLFASLLVFTVVWAFLNAGFYTIVFRRIHGEKSRVIDFFKFSIKNLMPFLRIGIFLTAITFFIGLAEGFFMPKLYQFIHNTSSIAVSDKFFFKLYPIVYQAAELFIYLLFVFAYPIVILSFFSDTKIKPVTTSISLVFKRFKDMAFIIILFLSSMIIVTSVKLFLSSYQVFGSPLISIIPSAFSFLILIYAYLFLTKKIFLNLQFDFEK